MQSRGDHVLKSVPRRIAIPVLAGDTDIHFAINAASDRLVFVGMNIREGNFAAAVLWRRRD
jgi:hypothetical protein